MSGVLPLLLIFLHGVDTDIITFTFYLIEDIFFLIKTICMEDMLKMQQFKSSCKMRIFDRFWTNLDYTDKL
jgi:hypothetical protein